MNEWVGLHMHGGTNSFSCHLSYFSNIILKVAEVSIIVIKLFFVILFKILQSCCALWSIGHETKVSTVHCVSVNGWSLINRFHTNNLGGGQMLGLNIWPSKCFCIILGRIRIQVWLSSIASSIYTLHWSAIGTILLFHSKNWIKHQFHKYRSGFCGIWIQVTSLEI
jgi:hypothetical protein